MHLTLPKWVITFNSSNNNNHPSPNSNPHHNRQYSCNLEVLELHLRDILVDLWCLVVTCPHRRPLAPAAQEGPLVIIWFLVWVIRPQVVPQLTNNNLNKFRHDIFRLPISNNSRRNHDNLLRFSLRQRPRPPMRPNSLKITLMTPDGTVC